jgi:hypothetical protein
VLPPCARAICGAWYRACRHAVKCCCISRRGRCPRQDQVVEGVSFLSRQRLGTAREAHTVSETNLFDTVRGPYPSRRHGCKRNDTLSLSPNHRATLRAFGLPGHRGAVPELGRPTAGRGNPHPDCGADNGYDVRRFVGPLWAACDAAPRRTLTAQDSPTALRSSRRAARAAW